MRRKKKGKIAEIMKSEEKLCFAANNGERKVDISDEKNISPCCCNGSIAMSTAIPAVSRLRVGLPLADRSLIAKDREGAFFCAGYEREGEKN